MEEEGHKHSRSRLFAEFAVSAPVHSSVDSKLTPVFRILLERPKPTQASFGASAKTEGRAIVPRLRDDGGTERRFADIDSLSRELDEGVVGEDVTIRWHRGEAMISREALLEDLREAVIPLSAGLVNEQIPTHPS